MRIPNYLRLAPSGIWHFHQRIPQPLTQKLGAREFTRSLGTRDLLSAQVRALTLAQAYAQFITEPRGLDVMATEGKGMVALGAKDAPQMVEVLPAARAGKKYRVVRNADGSVEIEANGKADHALAKDLVESIGPLSREAYVIEQATRPALSSDSKIPALPIGKVVTQWLADIKSGTKPKTFSIKTTAVENFARHYGEKNALKDAGRIDVGNWVQSLRGSGLQTPTIVNKCSYLRGFFDWAKARGYYPAFAIRLGRHGAKQLPIDQARTRTNFGTDGVIDEGLGKISRGRRFLLSLTRAYRNHECYCGWCKDKSQCGCVGEIPPRWV